MPCFVQGCPASRVFWPFLGGPPKGPHAKEGGPGIPWFTTRRILHIATATAQRTLAWCPCGPVGGHQLRPESSGPFSVDPPTGHTQRREGQACRGLLPGAYYASRPRLRSVHSPGAPVARWGAISCAYAASKQPGLPYWAHPCCCARPSRVEVTGSHVPQVLSVGTPPRGVACHCVCGASVRY